jgi:copper(I)-binding protein
MNAFIFFPQASRAWRALRAGLVMGIFSLCATAQAHGYDAGEVRIDHPYATPSPPGELSAQVYFRALKNRGQRPDKLLSARTPLTTAMAWQHIDNTQGAVRKTTVAAIDIPAHADVPMRHNSPQGHTLTLRGLPRPLAVGDRFSLWLRFEQAGEVEVKVVVQQPKDTPAAKTAHAH